MTGKYWISLLLNATIAGVLSLWIFQEFFEKPHARPQAREEQPNKPVQDSAAPANRPADQTVTPGDRSLGQTPVASPAENQSVSPSPTGVRPQFHANAIKIVSGQALMAYAGIGATFTIENQSDTDIGIGVVENSTSLGPCPAIFDLKGMTVYSSSQIQQIRTQLDPVEALQYLPAGSKVTVAATISGLQCPIQQGMRVDLTTSLVVAVEKKVLVLPANINIQVQ
jgi:hypothetical protein